MARSGGTLIARCLGCMDSVVLLSEIHPYGSRVHNPLQQAADWFQLFSQEELVSLAGSTLTFVEAIEEIRKRVEASGRQLVIRDWSHLDFTGLPFVESPPYRITISEVLGKHYKLIQTSTVRHPLDQWISLNKLTMLRDDPRLHADHFIHGYLKFAIYASKMGYLRYEDFTKEPDSTMQLLCERLELPYDKRWKDKWFSYGTVTGDNTTPSESRLTEQRVIMPLPRQETGNDISMSFEKNNDYRKSVELLGYTGDPI